MSTTLSKLAKLMKKGDLKFEIDDEHDRITLGFNMRNYVNPKGEKSLFLMVYLGEGGEYIVVSAPTCYSYRDGPNKARLFQTCLRICWEVKLVKFQYDPGDGEVRAAIELGLEDAALTQKQLMRCILGLVGFLEENHAHLQNAIDGNQPSRPQAAAFRVGAPPPAEAPLAHTSGDLEVLRDRVETHLRQKGWSYEVLPGGELLMRQGSTVVTIQMGKWNENTVIRLYAPVARKIQHVSPELTRFIVTRNNSLVLGKFSLDSKQDTVWFEHALLGDDLDPEELYRAVATVALVADDNDEEVCRMTGGKRVVDG